MKFSSLVFSLLFSTTTFAGTIGNYIQLSNLPTASKSYEVSAYTDSEAAAAKDVVLLNCKKDKAEAEAIVTKMGSKILSSKGCSVSVSGGFFDQNGSDYKIRTEFEVVFK